jgi:hypothetical protein
LNPDLIGEECNVYRGVDMSPKPQRGDMCVVNLVISSRCRVWKLDL